MKEPLSIKILTDLKEVRKAVAMLNGELLTDEQIKDKYFNPDKPSIVDFSAIDEEQNANMIVAFVAAMLFVQEEQL